MKRVLATSVLGAAVLLASPATAIRACPPNGLPDGSAYLNSNEQVAKTPKWVPGPGRTLSPLVEVNRQAPLAKASEAKGASATPIQLPGPVGAAKVKRSAAAYAAAQQPVKLPPRPTATPIQLPKPRPVESHAIAR